MRKARNQKQATAAESTETRRRWTAHEKGRIVRQHLRDGVPVACADPGMSRPGSRCARQREVPLHPRRASIIRTREREDCPNCQSLSNLSASD